MVSALLARQVAPMAARSMRGVRALHVENTVDTCLPFKQGPQHKTRLAIGVVSYLGLGFALPFIAVRFQLTKG